VTNASFDLTGGSSSVSVDASTSLCPWTATSNDSWIQIAGGGVTTTGSSAVAYTVLPNTSSSSPRVGTMSIAGHTLTVTEAGDTTAPAVVLTAPTAGIASNTIAVSATATDDVAVVKVEFYRDSGILLSTDTTAPYSMNFRTTAVSDGPHCFYARAYDAANNVGSSLTNCVTVDNQAPSVPTGLTATPVSTNQINLSWSASSDAGSGVAGYEVFRGGTKIATTANTNYPDIGLAAATEYCYKVAAYDGVGHLSQSADACAQTLVPLASLLGTYTGLIIPTNAPSHANSGSIRFVVSKTAMFAAKLTMGGEDSSFTGRFDASGNATNTVTRKPPKDSLLVILHLDSTGADQIRGTVTGNAFTSELLAERAAYSHANPCPWAGDFTVVFAPPEGSDWTIPQGYGYGTLAVTRAGSGRVIGVLGDGTKINVTAPLSKHGTWPLYDALYKNQGACIGWVTFGTNNTLTATVDWFRPPLPTSRYYADGFTTNLTLIGETYVSPAYGGPSAAGYRQVTLDGGNLGSDIVESMAVDELGNVTVLSANNEDLKMKFQLATGRFSGSFTHPVLHETISFNGLVLQRDSAGAGYFMGADASGSVTLQPMP